MPKVDKMFINMYDLLQCMTNAGDLISPEVADHHQRVAYLSYKIAEKMELSVDDRNDLMTAGLLHDMGAFSLDERLALIEEEPINSNDHAFRGARLIQSFPPLFNPAQIIRHHHVHWKNGEGTEYQGEKVSPLSHVLHLADRITILINPAKNVIGQIKDIQRIILSQKGTVFMPEAVDAFMKISQNEYIWLDLIYKPLMYLLPGVTPFATLELDIDQIVELSRIFARIIDFRNPFTANHSAGVAATAEKLAQYSGFSEYECKMMLVAGFLHDLGKLAVSKNILDKPDKLDQDEVNIIRSHTFYTYRLLQSIKGFEVINMWASFHHEKINGEGYPFHLDGENLPLGSRIMAVADIFTAIMEDRPYRKGMPAEKAIEILNSMADNNSICPYVVSILLNHFETVNHARLTAQKQAVKDYHYFIDLK